MSRNKKEFVFQTSNNRKSRFWRDFLLFSFLVHGLQAAGADFLPFPFNLLALEVYAEFPKCFDVGMADGVSGLGTAAADVAYSAHSHETWSTKHRTEWNEILFHVPCYVLHEVVDLLQNIR